MTIMPWDTTFMAMLKENMMTMKPTILISTAVRLIIGVEAVSRCPTASSIRPSTSSFRRSRWWEDGPEGPFRGAIAAMRPLCCFTGGLKSEMGWRVMANDVEMRAFF